VLLIHGNSSCRGVFRHQLQGTARKIAASSPSTYRATASRATRPDPTRSYTLPALADAAVELLEKLGVTEAIVWM
jgi:hypothetical protein